MSEPLEMIKHDDGTVTLHFASLSAGLLRIERLSNIEMYNLVREYEVRDGDGGPLSSSRNSNSSNGKGSRYKICRASWLSSTAQRGRASGPRLEPVAWAVRRARWSSVP